MHEVNEHYNTHQFISHTYPGIYSECTIQSQAPMYRMVFDKILFGRLAAKNKLSSVTVVFGVPWEAV